MNKEEQIKIIEELQQAIEQMKQDDIDENPESFDEYFTCDACGETKPLAGSLLYGENLLCNDCVLIAEIGFALKKIKTIDDVMKVMEDKKLEEICEFVKQEQIRLNN
ncbi:MAG: hypothetical protein PHV68_02845 [Candidatus Gastranaerophilales bacterium]|nr:hypothetical protein [Candidatus Gastranaerophilales bacterium]